jgi:hypothetical protein
MMRLGCNASRKRGIISDIACEEFIEYSVLIYRNYTMSGASETHNSQYRAGARCSQEIPPESPRRSQATTKEQPKNNQRTHTFFSEQQGNNKKSNLLKCNHFRNILILTTPNPAMAQGLLNIPTANAKLELGAPG